MSFDNYEPKKRDRDVRERGISSTDDGASKPAEDVAENGTEAESMDELSEMNNLILGSNTARKNLYDAFNRVCNMVIRRDNTIVNLRAEAAAVSKRRVEIADDFRNQIANLKMENRQLTSGIEAARGELQALKLAMKPPMTKLNQPTILALDYILSMVASWTSSRYDQHLRWKFGDEMTDRVLETLHSLGLLDRRPKPMQPIPCYTACPCGGCCTEPTHHPGFHRHEIPTNTADGVVHAWVGR